MELKSLAAAGCMFCAAAVARAEVNLKFLDPSVKPSDDFYLYAEGTWLKNHPIPADHSEWGADDELQGNNEKILHEIVEKAAANPKAGATEKRVGDFFFSGMDLATVNAVGAAPLKSELDRIDALASAGAIAAEVAHLHRYGVGVCFSFGSEQDPKNSVMMIAGQGQGGLGLPDRDYYLRDDATSKKLRDQYVAHVTRMLQLAGDSPQETAAEAQAVMAVETALAKGSKSAVDLRDPVANYHKLAAGELAKLSPHFDWNAYFAGMGLPPPASVDVGQPEFVQAFDRELTATPLSDWKAYFRWQLIHDNAPYLSAAFADENFSFFVKTLTGAPQQRDRWRRVLAEIDGDVGEDLGQLYVARAFPPQSKARVLKLVARLRQALHDRIVGLAWMDEPTRAAALRKLDAFGVKIGYPDRWIDYSALVIDRGPYVLNVLRSNEFNVRRDMAKIGKPVDRLEWGMTPPTVDAYYSPNMNEIVFPAGILQPPFFDGQADDPANYGGIGTVIGHEMTHGFDDEGRQYDPQGNLADWWSPQSAQHFKERSGLVVKQFSAYVAVDALRVNGKLTQGENIADLGGVKLAYAALEKDLAGTPRKKVDGFTPEQRFFLSYASVWRQNIRPEAVRLNVNTDPHSPVQFRVNGPLSNLAEFAQAFHVPPGAPMRRPAAEQVDIW